MALIGMTAFKDTVAVAGTANTHNISGAAGMESQNARFLMITNTHASQRLEITVSNDGSNYTAAEFDVPAASMVTIRGNFSSIKVDASGNSTTYTIFASRGED